jgi:inner membrane protein
MTFKTHDVFAFTSLLAAAAYFPPTDLKLATLIVALIANIIGALLPDIDQASNRLWDLLPGGNFIGKILKELFLSHRTLSHSILGAFLIYEGVKWLIPRILNTGFVDTDLIIKAIMIGYISHLVIDLFTEEGLPLLFPIKIKFGIPPIKKWRIKTGGWFEKWVVFPGILVLTITVVIKQGTVLGELIRKIIGR